MILFSVVTDFDKTPIVVTVGTGLSQEPVQFNIVDDALLELEEGFLAVIQLEEAMYPNLVEFDASRLTLIRIRDNDSEISSLECS